MRWIEDDNLIVVGSVGVIVFARKVIHLTDLPDEDIVRVIARLEALTEQGVLGVSAFEWGLLSHLGEIRVSPGMFPSDGISAPDMVRP